MTMETTSFEYVLCCVLVPVALFFAYLAGKCDMFNVVCMMFRERAKELAEALDDNKEE